MNYNPNEVFRVYSRDKKFTVVGLVRGTGFLEIGIAVKNEKDKFEKKVGFEVAYNKAMSEPNMMIKLPSEVNTETRNGRRIVANYLRNFVASLTNALLYQNKTDFDYLFALTGVKIHAKSVETDW